MIPEADIMVASEHRDAYRHSRFRLLLFVNNNEAKSFVTIKHTSLIIPTSLACSYAHLKLYPSLAVPGCSLYRGRHNLVHIFWPDGPRYRPAQSMLAKVKNMLHF